MRGCAERMTCPPLLTAFVTTPKFGGFPRAPTPSWRFATGRFEISSELHEGTRKRTCVPKTSRGRPQQTKCCLGGSEERSDERGACSTLCTTFNKAPLRITQHKIRRLPERATNRAPNARSAPLPNAVRLRGAANAPSFRCHGDNLNLFSRDSRWQAPFAGGGLVAERKKKPPKNYAERFQID